ncbi:MAG: CopG family transcriptional regulator [Candidatus Acidiferrales bacterium]
MASNHRVTIVLKPKVYRALKRKARTTRQNLSQIMDEALQLALAEDAADEQAIRERAKEPSVPFEEVRRRLKRDGLL